MPNKHSILECQLLRSALKIDDQSGIIITNEVLEKETELAFTSSLSTVGKKTPSKWLQSTLQTTQ